MKFPTYFFYALVSVCEMASAQEKDEAAESLDQARKLFPEFQKTMLSDPEKAKKSFDPFLKMPDAMQKRLQIWLDTQWAEMRREHDRATGGSSSSGGPSPMQKKQIQENRKLLEEIRKIGSEDEMKKKLKEKGWDALDALLRLTKRSGGQSAAPAGSSQKSDRLLKELFVIGDFRSTIRRNRGESFTEPYKELGVADPSVDSSEVEVAAVDSIEGDRKAKSVLAANEKMKGDIPKGEYEGILEVNQWRISMGLNALLIDPKLCEASRDHSSDMASMGFFAHESPVEGKKQPWDRAKNFGTTARAENIAINGSTPGANKAWFYSPGHHKNMFSGHTYIGLGIKGRHYTQLFR
ncbi:CAP domain-containing protein [Verrucomicrobiales bacterium]|nr:CAP domain-containing protein [Verrucomicrobiales bacterium]MDC0259424.1 CAP domain-containing protein [Verrucomicrobiales bacterium]MDC0314483.1 CAP domain-containing protein [bacterium]MDC0322134.1 CAP domain-containing protein [Verrucomicrobiales bacterium]